MVMVQLPLAGTVAPEIATPAPLLAPVTVGDPPQLVAALALAVLTRFAGYVSVKATPVTADALLFVSVIVRTLESFVPIDEGLNALVAVSEALTFSVAVAAAALAPVLV